MEAVAMSRCVRNSFFERLILLESNLRPEVYHGLLEGSLSTHDPARFVVAFQKENDTDEVDIF
jgi:hypothetical protein